MTSSTDLQQIFKAARPSVEAWLAAAEEFAAFRDMARTKGIDWAQVKALLKAQIQDEQDGTDKRVRAIVEKADNASSYAELLGISEKNNSRERAA